MVSVLCVVNEAISLSNALETAEVVANSTPAEVTVASLFDSSESDLDPDVAEFNVPILTLGAKSKFDPSGYVKVSRLLQSGNFDILHTHQNFTGSVLRVVGSISDVSIVDTEHNDHAHFSLAQNLVNAPTLPLADKVVSNSIATQQSFRSYEKILLSPSKCTVIYNGVDFRRIRNATLTVDLPEGPKIVTIGSLIKQKNQTVAINSLASVLEEVPSASLVIVGGGPLYRKLDAMASDLGIRESVHFTGYLPSREEVYGVMKSCDVCIMPSIYEGFCVAAVEAMACELPVIASDLPVFREVIGDVGYFAPPDDPVMFAKMAVKLLDDDETRIERGKRARGRAESRYQIEETADQYFNLYTKIAGND